MYKYVDAGIQRLLTAFIITVMLAGCGSNSVENDPIVPIIAPSGSVLCEHKYDVSQNFAYTLPINKSSMVLFEQEVITYEFTLLNGESRFLSGDEEVNYECKRVE